MATHLAQGFAEFLEEQGVGGLYSDATAANRMIWVNERPASDQFDVDEMPDPVVTVLLDGGGPGSVMGREYSLTFFTESDSSETAIEKAEEIYDLLKNNGGQSNGANANAQGLFNGIPVWQVLADFPPTPIGRDRGGEDGRFQVSQTFTVKTKNFTI